MLSTYFIANTRHVKIGKSHNTKRRLRALQTSSAEPLKILLILEGDREHELHQKFKQHRVNGEWFVLSKDILDFVGSTPGCFYEWLQRQTHRDEPVGDLANDAKGDTHFPRHCSDYKTLAGYLRWHPHACREARAALAKAFKEWSRNTTEAR